MSDIKKKYLKYKEKYLELKNNLNMKGGGDPEEQLVINDDDKNKSDFNDNLALLGDKCIKLLENFKNNYASGIHFRDLFKPNCALINLFARFPGNNFQIYSEVEWSKIRNGSRQVPNPTVEQLDRAVSIIPSVFFKNKNDEVDNLINKNIGVYVTLNSDFCDYPFVFKGVGDLEKIKSEKKILKTEINNGKSRIPEKINFLFSFYDFVGHLLKMSMESIKWSSFQKLKFCMKILDVNVSFGKYLNILSTIRIFEIDGHKQAYKGINCDNNNCLSALFTQFKEENINEKDENVSFVSIQQCGVYNIHKNKDYCFWCVQQMDSTFKTNVTMNSIRGDNDRFMMVPSYNYLKIFNGDELNNCHAYVGDKYKMSCRTIFKAISCIKNIESINLLEKISNYERENEKTKDDPINEDYVNEVKENIENGSISLEHFKLMKIKNGNSIDSKRPENSFY